MINNINNNINSNVIIPQIDPGVTPEDAYQLGLINGSLSVQESVGGTDQGDIYTFSIAQAGEYSFSLDGLSANADLGVFDAQGNPVNISQMTGTEAESFTVDLAQGDYFVTVASMDGGATNYNLNINDGSGTGIPGNPNVPETIIPTVDPGDGLNNAFDLANIQGTVTVADNLGLAGDLADVFQFTVDSNGLYNFSLDGLSANADLYLIDPNDVNANNEVVPFASSNLAGTEAESIAANLEAGTYFAAVISADGQQTEYNLNITDGSGVGGTPEPGGFETIVPTVDPGDTADTVYDLGAIARNISVQESVGASDIIDGYSFAITESGEYSFSLDGLTGDADLYVYDSDGYVMDFSEMGGTEAESLTLDLASGNYFVSVDSYDGVETSYSLNISSGSNTDVLETEPPVTGSDDTFETATDFGTFTNDGSNIISLADVVGGTDAVDFYQFTITESQQFNAAIENLTADADLVLYDAAQEAIAVSATDGIVDIESFNTTITAGTYTLGVHSWDGIETDYLLTIESSIGSSSPFSLEADAGMDLAYEI